MSTRITLLTVAAALAAAACGQDDLLNSSAPDPTGHRANVVATVGMIDGGVATVLDLGDGHAVATVENLGYGTPPAAAGPLAEPGYDSYACDSFGSEWVADWKDAFVGITKYRAAAYAHNYSPPYTFYPGAPVYYGTNTNSLTYLGACNGDSHDDLVMEVHRWISGAWTPIYTATIDGYQKFTFYSPIPARYRGRTYGADGSTVEHYGVGAAWTLSPSEATP
jgi:hypothetical protein